ncbi:MAG: hydrogenase maturation protease [Bacteroidota bacterium]|jgi:hydrogenase maturation protease
MIGNDFRKVLLIGIGNEYRSDDGIGLLIAKEIRKKQIPSVTVKEESGEGAALMEAWQGFQNVFIVDAVSSGAMPGTVFRIDANKETVPKKFFHYSTHAFSVSETIELARAMNVLPPKVVIYGIEGNNFAAGTTISLLIQQTAHKIIDQIVTDMQSFR